MIPVTRSRIGRLIACALGVGSTTMWLALAPASLAVPAEPPASSGGDYQVEVTKKGLGKEVSIRKGNKEWFMLIEVTPENTVIIRQEKDNDVYLVDESETHDRAMTGDEVNAVVDAFINGVQSQGKVKKK